MRQTIARYSGMSCLARIAGRFVWASILLLCGNAVGEGLVLSGGITSDGDLFNGSGAVFGKRDFESGAIHMNRQKTTGASAIYGAAATIETTKFCSREARPGSAIMSCGFTTPEEARSVAFMLLADKVANNPNVEYATGVEKNPKTGLYYPISPIQGKEDLVDLPRGKNLEETMHYHPQSERAMASLLDFAAANGEGVPGFIVTGMNGKVSPDVLRYDPNGYYSKYHWNDGIVEPVPGTEPRMLAELCTPEEKQTYADVVNNFSKDVLGEKGHIAPCPDTPVETGTFQGLTTAPKPIGQVVQNPNLVNAAANSDHPSGVVAGNAPPATPSSAQAYETIDYRGLKQWGTDLLNNTYSQVSAMADEEGVGAEYRSRASPILNQGLNYIQSIPDQVQVPVGQ